MKKSVWTLCLVLFSIMASYADKTIYVNTTVQGTGDGSSAANACKLGDAIRTKYDATAGAVTTIIFPSNTSFILADVDGTANASRFDFPVTSNKFIFEGNNSTLNNGSNGSNRIFRISSTIANIEIRNLNFLNGKLSGAVGGAIYFAGDILKITGCTFNNCGSDNGAALASRGKNVEIRNSYFLNNYLINGSRGAALTHTGSTSGGTLLIENTTFKNNTGKAGNPCLGTAVCTAKDGTSSNYLTSITFNNCTFYNNLNGLNSTTGSAAVYLDDLSGYASNVVFTNNTFYANNNAAINIIGIKQTVTLVNNVIVGDSYATVNVLNYQDHGVIAGSTIAGGRPAIVGKNNYIVAKNPIGATNITESSFQSGSNGNTFVSTTSQSVIDNVFLNSTLSNTNVPYLTITDSSSPLVNAGTNSVSGVTIPSTDITGFQRTPNYTIGAYQATLNVANGTSQIVNQNASLLSTTVQPTGKLTIAAGKTLTTGAFTIQSDASGTGTYLDNGTTTVTGITNVQQYLTSGRNWYIASPVSNATTASLSSTSSIVYYNEPTAQWLSPIGGSQLVAGKGYISTSTTATGAISFTGTLNTGTVNIPLTRTTAITKEGFNLVGNPYASYLDWSKVDTAAAKTLSTIWYRTQTAANAYTFDTYNGSGNVSTNLGATKVTNLIPPMQAFWVRVKQGESGGTLTFTNAMRAHGDYSTNIFKAPSAKTTTRQLVRLEVSTDVNRDETLIYFNENASNGYDAFDSPKMSNGSASIPEIYTNAGNEKLVINGMKNVTDDIELPLGFTTGQANRFSIKASEVTNLNDVDIILKDKLLNKEFNLLSGDTYSFTSDVVTTDSRFAVLFKTRSVNTALEPVSNGAKVYARANKGRITFINGNEPGVIIPVVIYNNAGQQVSNFNLNQSKTMLADRFAPGVYVVSFKSKQGISTQKIIVD